MHGREAGPCVLRSDVKESAASAEEREDGNREWRRVWRCLFGSVEVRLARWRCADDRQRGDIVDGALSDHEWKLIRHIWTQRSSKLRISMFSRIFDACSVLQRARGPKVIVTMYRESIIRHEVLGPNRLSYFREML